jgi:HD-GYP domain-containing protein (c-di-GMP phosphodiesterase class II)
VIPAGKGMSPDILQTGLPYLNNAADKDNRHIYKELFGVCKAAAGSPLTVRGQIIGILWVGSIRELNESDLRLLTAVADIAANAIHRATLHEQALDHLHQLGALRQIDQAINSSLDLRISLELILKHGQELLQADALAILLYNPHTLYLDYAASTGFQTDAIRQTHIRIGEGLPGRIALERRMAKAVNLRGEEESESRRVLAEAEGFYIYHAAPLVVKGEIKGIFEVYHRSIAFKPDAEWTNILSSLSTQAAIAIDNTTMFDGLQRSSQDLMLAYEETIEGWAKALEQRDHNTEGHTQRTKALTINLARAAGIPERDMPHLVRGILLHDIGKMGIPDAILNKPGPLNDEEWQVMRAHPAKAYQMLSSIKYLKPALDIPYCHHEKWDGTGYPRGLKGEEIPLAARIFAIVDVFDALTSDRPYRKAWPLEKTMAYIREQSGRHFDPEVVKIFLEVLEKS